MAGVAAFNTILEDEKVKKMSPAIDQVNQKIISGYHIVGMLVLMVCMVIGNASVRAESVRIITGEWFPYVSKDIKEYGFAAEIVTYAFLVHGIEVHIEFVNWEQCEKQVRSGSVFASFPQKKTAERHEFALFSAPIALSKSVLFFKKENLKNFTFKQIDDLKGYRIGGTRGYFYESMFKKAGIPVEYVSLNASSIKKLYIGVVDLVPENEFVGWGLIQKLYPDEMYRFQATQNALSENTLHLMVSRQDPRARVLLEKFDKGLRLLQEKGIYQKILKRYVRDIKIKIPTSPY